MNTFISRISGNSFCKAISAVALVAVIITGQAASAQSITVADNETPLEKQIDKFQANVHPVQNSLTMKVHFINPNKELVSVSIYDQSKNLVYNKIVGRAAIFHGQFNLANLPDGKYTVQVNGRKASYSQSLSIQTQQERFALAN